MPSAAAIKRVLIVEDLQTLSIAYAAQVEKAGYQPVVAATAAEALQHLAAGEDFAAILLDLQLPDADGLDLLRNHQGCGKDCGLSRQEGIGPGARGWLHRSVATDAGDLPSDRPGCRQPGDSNDYR